MWQRDIARAAAVVVMILGTGTYVGTYGTVGTSLYHGTVGTYGRYRTGRYMEERKFEPISNRDSSYPGLGVVEVEREPCQ